jgi:hypothetical protein
MALVVNPLVEEAAEAEKSQRKSLKLVVLKL